MTFDIAGTPNASQQPTLRIESSTGTNNKPGGSLGALTWSQSGTTVTATTTGIDLDADTIYYVVLETGTSSSPTITYQLTDSDAEDAGRASGWGIGDHSLNHQLAGSPTWNSVSTTSWKIAIHGYAKSGAAEFSSASYANSLITVDFNKPFLGCADRLAWRFKVDGSRERFPRAVYCGGQSVHLFADISQRPVVESARRVTVSYHRGFARMMARRSPGTSPLHSSEGTEVASFSDKPVTGLRPWLVPPPTVDGRTLTLTFTETLDPASGVFPFAFDVTVNGARRDVVAGGVAIAGKTVTLTLASAVAPGDTVRVRYTNGSPNVARRTLRGANGLAVDTFEYQAADNPITIWSDTLTVKEQSVSTHLYHGCFDLASCEDSLTRSSFVSGGTTYTFTSIVRNYSLNRLAIQLDRAIPRGWTLRVGDRQFPVANATLIHGNTTATWTNPGLTWTDGQQVPVRLTIGGASGDSGGGSDLPTSLSRRAATVSVVSDPGADKTYGLGDTIRVRVTFAEAVEVTGTPRLKIDMDPAYWGEKWAVYQSGSGTESLTFAHEVVEPNISTQGIAVLENTLALNGGTVRWGGVDADLAHAGRPHDANHKVNWQTQPEGGGPVGTSVDSGPPTVTGVRVVSDPGDDDTYLLGDTIQIRATFSEAVTVTGSPRLSIDMDPAAWGTKQAAYESGGGTRNLTFTHTVVEPNYSTQGIAVLANTLALNGGTIRSAGGTNAALGHTGLGHDSGHKVDWRPEVSVADASATEAAGAKVAFEVSLSRAFTTAAHRVTVDYATSDGTAVAGSDYTTTSGTLTFAAGESSKTVNVPILDDAVDEGSETFTLRLSNATGARIGDGEATGTITNDDPLQKMLLSRIGRTMASHLTGAVSDRLAGPLAGAELSVGGQRVDLAQTEDSAALAQALSGLARVLGANEGPAPGDGPDGFVAGGWPGTTGPGRLESAVQDSASARRMSGRELLLGSAFHLAREGEGGGPGLAAWGRVTTGGFDGEAPADEGGLRVDGEVTTGILGADAEWNRLLAGVAVSVSEGEGSFDQPGVDSGTFESSLTAVSPYARLALTERVSTWGLLGFGTGDMTIAQAANERGQPERVTRTDIEMRLVAAGARGALMEANESGGIDLALRADAFHVETESEAVSNEGSTTGVASRVRLALEGSRAFGTGGGGTLTPGLELGLRHDGGDAETGTGVELGGRVSYADPETGFSVEARVRTLVAHEDSDYREWGASGAVRLDPGERGRGLSFSLSPTWGAASSGMGRLWSARDARGLAPEGEFEARQRLEGEVGYGLALFGDRFTGTPNLGFGLSDTARDWRIGWRLTSAARGDPGFEAHLDATRRERAHGDEPPEHAVMLTGVARW